MKKFIAISTAFVVSLSATQAFAGGWGKGGQHGVSSGLVNVSPTVNLGSLNALNGIGVLNGSAILSGNNVSGILNGIGINGVLSGIGVNILGPNKGGKKRRH